MDQITVRLATIEDIPALLSVGQRFVEETSLPLTFDPELATDTLRYMITDDRWVVFVGEYRGRITGGILGVVERDFCVEPCAYISKMYVERNARGFGTAQLLVERFTEEVTIRGARIIFSSATAGMGEQVESLYTKLLESFNYRVLGRVLIKEMNMGKFASVSAPAPAPAKKPASDTTTKDDSTARNQRSAAARRKGRTGSFLASRDDDEKLGSAINRALAGSGGKDKLG